MTYLCNPLTPTSIPNKGEEHAAGTGTKDMSGAQAKVGDAGQPCRPQKTQGDGICGTKAACADASRIKTGRCNGGSDNLCCESPPGASSADAEDVGADAMGGLKPLPGTDVEDLNLLGRVMRKVGEFMGRLWDKMKGFAKTMQNVLYTMLRCGVCVVCNIVNEIVALFKQLLKRLKDMGGSLKRGLDSMAKSGAKFFDNAGNRVRELFGSKGNVKANDTKLELGTSCITAEDCASGYCAGGRFVKKCVEKHAAKVGEVCTGRDDDCEKGLFCKGSGTELLDYSVGHRTKCTQLYKIGDKCHYDHSCATGYCKGTMRKKCAERVTKSSKDDKQRRRLLALTSAQRMATRQHHTAQHRVRARKMRQLHRLSVMVQAADKIDRAFAEGHLMNSKMAASLITSIFSFMQVHSRKREAAKANKAKAESNAKFSGIIPLPNACVNEENQGTSMVIAINVENPNVSALASVVY